MGSVFAFQGDAAIRAMAHGMLGVDGWTGSFQWNAHPWKTWSALVVLIGLMIPLSRLSFPVRRFLWVVSSPLYVMGGVYHASLRHAGLIYVTWLAFVIDGQPKLRRSLWVGIPVVLMFFASLRWISSWKPWQVIPEFDLSGSGEVSHIFKSQFKSERSVLIVLADEDWEEAIYFPVSGVLDAPLFSARRHRFLAYPFFSLADNRGTISQWCREWGSRVGELFPNQQVYFGRFRGRVPPEGCAWRQRVFESARPVLTEEVYSIYSTR